MNGNIETKLKKDNIAERDIVVKGTYIHIKSVFNDKIPLEKALGNIAAKKLSAKSKN